MQFVTFCFLYQSRSLLHVEMYISIPTNPFPHIIQEFREEFNDISRQKSRDSVTDSSIMLRRINTDKYKQEFAVILHTLGMFLYLSWVSVGQHLYYFIYMYMYALNAWKIVCLIFFIPGGFVRNPVNYNFTCRHISWFKHLWFVLGDTSHF